MLEDVEVKDSKMGEVEVFFRKEIVGCVKPGLNKVKCRFDGCVVFVRRDDVVWVDCVSEFVFKF